MSDTEFADGLLVKAPRAGAPEYVMGSLSIKRLEFIAWLQSREGDWVNLEMKTAKSGKPYAAVDNWKPGEKTERRPQATASTHGSAAAANAANAESFPDDDIPF